MGAVHGVQQVQPADAFLVGHESAAPAVGAQHEVGDVPVVVPGDEHGLLFAVQRAVGEFRGPGTLVGDEVEPAVATVETDRLVRRGLLVSTRAEVELALLEVEQVDARVVHADELLHQQPAAVVAEVRRTEPGAVGRLEQQLLAARASWLHPPQVVVAAVATGRLEGHPAPVTAPASHPVARDAVAEATGIAVFRVEEKDLVLFATSLVHRDRE